MADGGRRTADEALAAELATGKTVRDAATAAGVAERTVYRRLGEPEFRAKVAGLRAGMLSAAAGRLADSMAAAADHLRALLGAKDPNVRLRAATQIVTLALKVTELADLERRVKDLEDRSAAAPARRAVGGKRR